MNQTDAMLETVLNQAKQVISCIKDLKYIASDKGQERGKLIEKCTANIHSFNVYTYASETIKNSKEAENFQQKISDWINEFNNARFDVYGDVDVEKVNELYEAVVLSFNEMMTALGYEHETLR